jgi:16S rRNA (guanine966-N2)-methyltransferase
MRVIAGSAGGIQLQVPNRGVRPTMDRVKAAIFSSLADKVQGARVLDLFAGSGGLAIEALSRGAASALLVDHDRKAVEAIEQNLRKAKVHAKTRQQDVFEFLKNARSLGQYDLVFADPPYEPAISGNSFTDLLLSNEGLFNLVGADGVFVLEKRPGEPVTGNRLWQITRRKAYGATEVLFLVGRAQSAVGESNS